jgi:carbonic anhydrase/acetyltransferase-like protein (isoleucine patch superfamily)
VSDLPHLQTPTIHPTAFIADTARVVGNVTIGEAASVWFGAVLRCEVAHIHIGEGCSIQDNAVLHSDEGEPTELGKDVTVGHSAVIHAAIVDDEALVGMGAIVLNRAHVGRRAMVAAGSLVPPGMEIPDGMLAIGSPAKVVREVKPEEWVATERGIHHYRQWGAMYRDRG